jgi:hypothetical protein
MRQNKYIIIVSFYIFISVKDGKDVHVSTVHHLHVLLYENYRHEICVKGMETD